MNANLYITGIRILGVAALLSVTSQAYAQEDKKDKNLNREMTLEREYDPSVQDASKVNSLPTIKEPQIKKNPIDYANFTLPVEPGKEIGILSSGKIMTDMSYNKRRGYFNFAGGTYLNLNGDLGYHILSTDKDQLNFSFGHRSTNGKIKLLVPDDYSSGTGDIKNKAKLNDNLGTIHYKHEFDNLSFKLGAQYGYSAFNYYGYYPRMAPEDELKSKNQANQQIFFDLGFASKERTSFNYLIDLAFRNFSHKYGMDPGIDGVKENAFGGKLGLNTELDSDKKVGIDALIDYFSYSVPREYETDFTGFNNHAEITLTPYFAMQGVNWNLKLGVNAMFITGDNNKVFASPHITAEVEVADATVLYGNFLGSIHANSMYNISLENRYADPTQRIMPSRTWLDGTIGIKSGVAPGFWFDIFAGYKITDNEHFFLPKYGDGKNEWGNVGKVEYLDSKVLQVGASFKYSYQQLVDITLKGVYNSWDVSDINKDDLTQVKNGSDYKAYNKPELEIEAGLTVKPIDKLAIALNYYLGSGRYTLDTKTAENIKMDNINDLNLTGSYAFNDTFGAYLKFNNVLCQKYDLFPGYTAQGFNAMVGVNINF